MSRAETHASILSLPDLVNNDAALVRRGRYLTATFLVEAGDTEFLVRVVEGRIAEAWPRFWEPVHAPGYHDLLAMKKLGVARIEGDLTPMAENPAQFRRYLLPVLDEIRAAAR
jgi:hypothetical protein